MAATHPSNPNNPQAEQMSDESMLRNLAAQAEAIWPQEQGLLDRYQLDRPAICDVGCGPGELSERLLDRYPGSTLIGVDLDPAHLERARARCARFGDRARFAIADATELVDQVDGAFDLVICRHLLQAVPEPGAVLAQMKRVARAGGRLHAVAEDYSMMHFWPVTVDTDEFWRRGPIAFAAATGTDLRSGRKIYTAMIDLGLTEVRVDYVTLDTSRVPRALFARIWTAWRDGYAPAIARYSELDRDYVVRCFDEMIECICDPRGYAVWQLPVITAVVGGA
jgi:ubiquinone/menaquinone biosynthesis C-methylase UbiE